MLKQNLLLSLLMAIFAFSTVTACETKKSRKRRKRARRKERKKEKRRRKKEKKVQKVCKKLFKQIPAKTAYTKKDILNKFGSKEAFMSACRFGARDGGPFKKLIKCKKHDEPLAKCGKKHLAKLFGKKVKKVKKDKIKKEKKLENADDEEGKNGLYKDVTKLGEKLYKKALKDDFEAVKKLLVTKEDVKAFDKGIHNKFANEKKLKSTFTKWVKMFKDTKFKKVKAKDDEKQTVKPGEKVKKLEELTAAISAPVKVWNVNVKADKAGKTAKCAFVAIKLGDKWKLIRLKGCKVK